VQDDQYLALKVRPHGRRQEARPGDPDVLIHLKDGRDLIDIRRMAGVKSYYDGTNDRLAFDNCLHTLSVALLPRFRDVGDDLRITTAGNC